MIPAIPLFALLAGWHSARPAPTLPGEAVVRAAYAQYGGRWFKTALFAQRTQYLNEERTETWYVSLQPPGFTRIDVAPASTGRALVYRNDTTYQFGKMQLRGVQRGGVEPLLALLHDLHSDAPDKTIAMLKRFAFDLGKTHERMWDGERVIVVGALAGDTVSNQFWLEKKRMILVRLLEQNGSDPRRPLDARISGYKRAGAGWLETNIRQYLGGVLSTVEDYFSVQIDLPLEAGLFQPTPYHLPRWVNGARDVFGGTPDVHLPAGGH